MTVTFVGCLKRRTSLRVGAMTGSRRASGEARTGARMFERVDQRADWMTTA